MGACYSRKASKSQSSSSFADHPRMATGKHEEISSRTRPTPYSRNIPQPNPPVTKKSTFIPKPSETFSMDGKHHGRSSSIPRPTGPKNTATTTEDTNSNHSTLSDSHHLVNNNVQQHLLTSPSKTKHISTKVAGQPTLSKIPSKLTAHLANLRPQVAQILQKNMPSNDSIKDADEQPGKTTKSNHDPSPEGEEWDSGLGSSITEKPTNKSEDAETLKDFLADESLEGSPIISNTSNALVLKHIIKFENISNLKTDGADIPKKNNPTKSHTLKQNSFNSPTATYRGVFNYSESYGTPSNPPPLTYGSYRNYLSYRKNISTSSNFSYWHGIEEKKNETKEERIKSGKTSKLPSSLNSKISGNNKSGIFPAKEQPNTKSSLANTLQSDTEDISAATTLSPVAELENRQFLIDDEISDQPALISFQQQQQQLEEQQHSTLRDSVSELQALKLAAASPQPASTSCTVSCSDDSVPECGDTAKVRAVRPLQPRPRSLGCEAPRARSTSMPLRPPRQMFVTEQDDGCVRIDASSYRLLCQDLNSVKTMLHRLKSIIYDAETLNPFNQVGGSKNVFYQSMAHNDLPVGCPLPSPHLEEHKTDLAFIQQENADLRRQLVFLQQQLEDRDHTIKLLQQQMLKYEKIPGSEDQLGERCNSATQTDRLGFSYAPTPTEDLLPTSPPSTLVSFNCLLASQGISQ